MKREIRRVEDLSEDEYANYEAHPEEWLDVTERTIEDSLKMIGEAGIENCEWEMGREKAHLPSKHSLPSENSNIQQIDY